MNLNTHMTVRPPTSPGEMLVEEFLKPLGMSQAELGERTKLGPRTINEICKGKRAITARTAILLSDVFGMSVEFWLDLQRTADLWKTLKEMNRLKNAVKSQSSRVVDKKKTKKTVAPLQKVARADKTKKATSKKISTKQNKETQKSA